MEKQKDKLLRDTYYDPKFGFHGTNKMRQKLLDPSDSISKLSKDLNIKYTDVHGWILQQPTFQLHKQRDYGVVHKHIYQSWIAFYPAEQYQIDLIDFRRNKYKGFKWIFCIEDVYTRKAWAIALKHKGPTDYIPALDEAIMEHFDGKYPEIISGDNDFDNRAFSSWADKHHVKVRLSQAREPLKNALVERFNRTLEHMLALWQSGTDRVDWPNVLSDLVYNYNHTIHSRTQAKPQDIWDGKAQNHQDFIFLAKQPLDIGDLVRIKSYGLGKAFIKGDAPRSSRAIYKVIGRGTNGANNN